MEFVKDINKPKKEEIQALLDYVGKLMDEGNLFIWQLKKNNDFFIDYNIDTIEKQYEIIRKLTVNHFCKCQIGNISGLLGEVLYVFRTVERLTDFTLYEEDVEIFIKFGRDKQKNEIVTVSFHDSEHDMKLYNWEEE